MCAPDTTHCLQIRAGAVYHGGAGASRVTRINHLPWTNVPPTLTRVVFWGVGGRGWGVNSKTVGIPPNRNTMQTEPAAGRAAPVAPGESPPEDGARHLKKSDDLLCQGNVVKTVFITHHKKVWPVDVMCRVLGVSRNAWYRYCQRRRQRPAAATHQAMQSVVRELARDSGYSYGSRRIQRALAGPELLCGPLPGALRDAPGRYARTLPQAVQGDHQQQALEWSSI